MELLKRKETEFKKKESDLSPEQYYSVFVDDFGTKNNTKPKGFSALFFGKKDKEFPPGFYPEIKDFGDLFNYPQISESDSTGWVQNSSVPKKANSEEKSDFNPFAEPVFDDE